MDDSLTAKDKEFLALCEEEFKDRFTENDKEFMKVFNKERPTPPILENWCMQFNDDKRSDRRQNRRFQPYNRDYQRNRDNNRNNSDHRRSYNDHNSFGLNHSRY